MHCRGNLKWLSMKLFLFILATFGIEIGNSQSGISVSVEFGLSPKAKNVMDSSYVNPGHRNSRLLAATFSLDDVIKFNNRGSLGVSVRNSIIFSSDGWTNGNDIDGSGLPLTGKRFYTGVYDFYNLKSSVGLNFKYRINSGKINSLAFLISPEIAAYWPVEDNRINVQVFDPVTGYVYTLYDGIIDYKRGINGYTRVAFKLENTFTLLYTKKIFKTHQAGFEFNYHLGPKNLEVTRVIFYPDFPQFRAKVHYSHNNNYCSFAFRYYFAKPARKK